MNASPLLVSFVSFVFSAYGLAVFAFAAVLAGLLWGDQLKKRHYDGEEKKKWRYWNTPKARLEQPLKREDRTAKR